MPRIPKHITERLNQRKEKNALRTLKVNHFKVDFYSNDYLGFASSREIKQFNEEILSRYPIQHGATGSRLISGHTPLHEIAEHTISEFHHSQSCLLFNSGYDANVGLFSSIPKRGDIILFDEYIHASIRDGISLGLAQAYKFKHNDLESLERLLQKYTSNSNNIFIATESVFSMDGDSPDLEKMVLLAEKYNAFLIVDEAHALGVLGKDGCGLVQHLGIENRVFARIMTYGKALGGHGASVLSSNELKQYLVNFARSFIYTTAMPPHSLAHILAGYQELSRTQNRELLQKNIAFFLKKAEKIGLKSRFIPSQSAIQGIVLSGNDFVKSISEDIQKEGFGVIPILSPTVAEGQERLRICLHSFNTFSEIENLCNILITKLK
ncbi:aminotransferase class I/II-fold pyridoxal phosphate-dependent enzyme [Capnocytophaga canimorsus]|uniref:aminotransferase class I/II-fold pyridoxal phosphate-dependent enzyme n=1 Tax=Capnocytophaga canimorsus TaxID=28188 RepID=UPI0037D26D83